MSEAFVGPTVVPLDSFVAQRMSTMDITAFEELVSKVNEVIYALRDNPVHTTQQEEPSPNFNMLSGRLVSKGAQHGVAR